MTPTPAVPTPPGALPDDLDPAQVSDAACTLVELSTVPEDWPLIRRAAEQLTPLTAALRRITGTEDASDDRDWLNPWRGYGIVIERH